MRAEDWSALVSGGPGFESRAPERARKACRRQSRPHDQVIPARLKCMRAEGGPSAVEEARAPLCAGSKKGQENVDPSQPCQPSPLARISSHLVSACTRPKTADGDAPSSARSLRELKVLQKKQSHQVPGTCGLTRSMPSSPHLTARADMADDTGFSNDKKPSVLGALPQCQVGPL